MKLTRAALAVFAAATIVFAACGGDDDDSADTDNTSTTKSGGGTGSEYVDVLAAAFSRDSDGQPVASSQEEANCAATRITDEIDEERLIEAGLTLETLENEPFGSSGYPDLTDDEAATIVDAMFECIDLGTSLGAEFVAGGPSSEQGDCLNDGLKNSDAFHDFYTVILREGDQTSMNESNAGEFVDVLFECIGQGEFFRSSVSDLLTLTDEQATCLDDSLASSSDYRDALVGSFMGKDTTGTEPAYRDEVERCVPPEELDPSGG